MSSIYFSIFRRRPVKSSIYFLFTSLNRQFLWKKHISQFLSERSSCVGIFCFMEKSETGSHLLVRFCCASVKAEPSQIVFIFVIVA